MGLFDKINIAGQDPQVRQARKNIEDIRVKKEQLLKSIDADINNISFEMGKIFETIGEKLYEDYIVDTNKQYISTGTLVQYEDIIKNKKEELKKLDKKREEINNRYSEEIELLQKLIPSTSFAQANDSISEGVCPNCNAVKNDGDLFCTSCGSKF